MNSDWLYFNLGRMAQVAVFAALLLIGILALRRRRRQRKLDRSERRPPA